MPSRKDITSRVLRNRGENGNPFRQPQKPTDGDKKKKKKKPDGSSYS